MTLTRGTGRKVAGDGSANRKAAIGSVNLSTPPAKAQTTTFTKYFQKF